MAASVQMSDTRPSKTPKVRSRASRRRWALLILLIPLLVFAYSWWTYPSDRTPEGAYLRVVSAVNRGAAAAFFAYTEEAAQHACFSIRDYRKQTLLVAEEHYPTEELALLKERYEPFAAAQDGADVFALMVEREGWLAQLRRDVSGVKAVEEEGPRASVITSKGTRYAFRKRPNGIWGMTAFTPTLVDEKERAARDLEQVEKAAKDFARVASESKDTPPSAAP